MMLHKLTHRCTTPKNLGIIAVSRRTLVCKSIGTKSSVTIVHAATSWSVLRVAGASVLLQLPTARMIQTASSAHAAPTATAHQVATHMAAGALMPTALAGSQLMKSLLLVSDFDDTLVGNAIKDVDSHTTTFKTVWERSRASGINCKLAINTGRTLPLFEEAWQKKKHLIPEPDIVIGGVGTRIYYNTPTGWVEDSAWTQHMNVDWDSHGAKAVMDNILSTFGSSNVMYREPAEMHDHKLTIVYQDQLVDQLLPRLRQLLHEAGIQATVIEGGCAHGGGLRFIDLLPRNAGKGTALQYVRQRFAFDEDSTVAAGDSSNDLLMLQQCRLCIAVGNSVDEVKQWVSSVHQGQQQQQPQGGHTAQPGKQQQTVYLAKQPVAAGVLEGLAALGFLSQQAMN